MGNKEYLDVTFERQNQPTSCAAKCVQMVMHYYDASRFPLGKEAEEEIMAEASFDNYDVATHPALARFAQERGFQVTYLTKYPDLYRLPETAPRGWTMPKEEFEEKISVDRKFLITATKAGVSHEVMQSIEPGFFQKYIDKGAPVICMTDSLGSLHDVIVHGYTGTRLRILDPIRGYDLVEESIFRHRVDGRYGHSFLIIEQSK